MNWMIAYRRIDLLTVNRNTWNGQDVLSLAKSSKAFLPILSDQTYWASVFDYDAECDFLFEAPLIREFREVDWIAIYKRTMYLKDIPGLENRKRIWTIVKEIAKLLELYPPFGNPDYDGDDCTFVDEIDDWWEVEDQDPGLRKWKVEADIKPTALRNEWFYEGCRLLYEQVAPIPEDLVSIAFSIAVAGNTEYLAGMRFISEDGSSIQLGYRNMYEEHYHEVTALKGFIIAIGSRGFHGLRVLGADGSTSRWFGSPKDSPVTERLEDIDSASVLKIGFDGYKIVDLGLVVLDRTNYDHVVAPFELRKAALWYPAVPASNLFLNDQSFTGEHPFAITYQPLCYIHFGGRNGIHLRTLTEIRVYAISDILEIDFQYETNATQPIEIQRLGRIDIEDFSDFVQTFSIDGPGEEMIQSVEVSVKRTKREDAYSFERHGKLDSFKVGHHPFLFWPWNRLTKLIFYVFGK
ncbi:hypothetical protein ZTR_02164 [Talaromyces verruculosus]|nr:hypothetical protein ZTR_02164 [Talaromyces verruculosus]